MWTVKKKCTIGSKSCRTVYELIHSLSITHLKTVDALKNKQTKNKKNKNQNQEKNPHRILIYFMLLDVWLALDFDVNG